MPDETDPPAPKNHPLIDRYRESYQAAALATGLGTAVGAVGQTLRAAADTAVNTSPFLSDEQKAYAMS